MTARLAVLVALLALGVACGEPKPLAAPPPTITEPDPAPAPPAAAPAELAPDPVDKPDPSAKQPDRKFNYTGTAMGTVITVWFWTDDEAKAAKAAADVFTEMKRLDKEMTTWDPASEVSQIIAAAGAKPVVVSEETYAVIERAVDISKRSHGIFDITVGAFKGLWKFDEDMDGTLPDPLEVKKRLQLIGWKDIVLDKPKHSVFLRRKGMSITLGGIAKGYAVDKCVKLLYDQGFVDFMVQAGGDMFVAGKKGAEPWMVGIRDPRAARDEMFAVMPIENHSFSTSGDYERGFVKDGKRYHHILDPRNGQPAVMSRSVTIRAKDAFTADAWSKVLFILGWQEAEKLIAKEKLEDFEAVWVDDKNAIHTSAGLQGVLKILKQPTPGP
jgi:thiamine biosynthesis lipoprotein